MADENLCPRCGSPLPAGALPGLCHRCLLLDVLAEETSSPGDATRTDGSDAAPARPALEGTEPDLSITRGPADLPGPSTVQDPARAASDLTTSAADLTRTANGNDPSRDLLRAARVRYVGDYEVNRELGRGGMGVVYQARQVSLNRPVALKMIRAGMLADDAELRRWPCFFRRPEWDTATLEPIAPRPPLTHFAAAMTSSSCCSICRSRSTRS